MPFLAFNVLAQCPVANLPADMKTNETADIEGGNKVIVTCKYSHRAYHPLDQTLGVTGNSTHNMWTIECDDSTNNFTWPNYPKLPTCKCIVTSALEEFSENFELKNFTSAPVEGTDPISVGDKITFKCKDDEAEVDDTMSDQCK
jgi:hypothetical protein